MNAVTLLNELHVRNVAVLVVGADRLRFEARAGSITEELISDLRAHKPAIIAILSADGSIAKLLGRVCPFCHVAGMRIEETWKGDLLYFDTRCVHCSEIVETCVPPCESA